MGMSGSKEIEMDEIYSRSWYLAGGLSLIALWFTALTEKHFAYRSHDNDVLNLKDYSNVVVVLNAEQNVMIVMN